MAAFSKNLVAGSEKEGNPGPYRTRIGTALKNRIRQGVSARPVALTIGNAPSSGQPDSTSAGHLAAGSTRTLPKIFRAGSV